MVTSGTAWRESNQCESILYMTCYGSVNRRHPPGTLSGVRSTNGGL